MSYQRILVPLDGSPRSEESLEVATEIALRFGSRVDLLVASNVSQSLFVGNDDTLPLDYRKLKEHQRSQIVAYLQRKAKQLGERGLEVEIHMLEDDPADAIVDCAQENEVDLLVMTSHGRRGWSRWISGSVAESVLRRVPCPCLVLRRPRKN